MPCIGIKASGDVCGKRCMGDAIRCATHTTTQRNKGPNQCAIDEMWYLHKKQKKDLLLRFEVLWRANPREEHRRIDEDYAIEKQQLVLNQNREMTELTRRQRDLIAQTGVDPDLPARQARQIREAEQARRRADFNAARRAQLAAWGVDDNERINNAAPGQAPPPRELAGFAQDPQNVHTTQAVQMVKAIVKKVLEIQVPEEYKWNELICSKTPGEIIMLCKLTPSAAWQMGAKYCSADTIYELGKGIYGKVLDSVWQFILKSEHKEDLCRILKSELQDNIGMCAQGNLSRLANILAGYLEGVGSQESLSEKLGRLIPALMEIEDLDERADKLVEILNENQVPKAEWIVWGEPLFDGFELSISESNCLIIKEI